MSAMAVLKKAADAGLSMAVTEAGNLKLKAPAPPPPELIEELKRNKPAIIAVLSGRAVETGPAPASPPKTAPVAPPLTSWPEPAIKAVPPFGSGKVPSRYEAGWNSLLAEQPSWCTEAQWCDAIFGCRDLFGEWGAELLRLNWQPENIFDRWHGLAWFLKGGEVTAIGPYHAFLQDGRIFEGKRR